MGELSVVIEGCFTTFVKLIHDVRLFVNGKKMEGKETFFTSVQELGKGECGSFIWWDVKANNVWQ